MEHRNFVRDGEITVFADASLFSKEAILKCLYWFGDKFRVNVSLVDANLYQIILKPLANAGVKEEESDLILQKLERDLIDFQLRDIITKETQNVRDLLLAKAFSHGEFDEAPQGDISDPVGYNPNASN
ncbi:MAG: His-Xaa-Ser system protein HxsD [Candidatus Nephrothrix sp. EaCA]|nr:MAG: His-Xaa-Ser system protein HxsD [Candidatus Nephrothrix sp. EaCA]